MKPQLEKILLRHSSSISVKHEISPYMDYPWHYHPEYEIIYVEKSYGIRFMGNHIGPFTDGDLMLISSNLPHVWKNDQAFHKGNEGLKVDVYVIHFTGDALKEGFFDLPEFTKVKTLFQLGTQGLLVLPGKQHKKIARLIKETVNATRGIERIISFIKTLDTLSVLEKDEYELLSSPGYINKLNVGDEDRINTVMNYVMQHYSEEINLEKVSQLINLTNASFSRYFKYKTHKTFSEFLNEIRIVNACKLLINTDLTIAQICYRTGYNNISHFNRQFKLITGVTANRYKRNFMQKAFQD